MQYYPFEPFAPPYGMDGLSPDISEYTSVFHFDGIYRAYVEKLNGLIEKNPRLNNVPLERLIGSSSEDVRYYAGAVYDHEIYFSGLSAEKTEIPRKLSDKIDSAFGSYDGFMKKFTEASVNFRGAGYSWLCMDMSGRLRIGVTTLQNPPDQSKLTPLLCCDLWEHAYYLDRQFRRGEYIAAWAEHIDWNSAAARLVNEHRRG